MAFSGSFVKGGTDYYTSGGAGDQVADYYVGAGQTLDPSGRWFGALAERVGLTGEVNGEDMADLFSTFVAPDGTRLGQAPAKYRSIEDRLAVLLSSEPDALPERVAELRREAERSGQTARQGYDLTYSPVKSVSIKWAAAFHAESVAEREGDLEAYRAARALREAYEDAVREASRAGLDYALSGLYAPDRRAGHAHEVRWVPLEEFAGASFLQYTSREGDPQLHVHNPILNRALDATGSYRAPEWAPVLKTHAKGFDAIAARVLEQRLAQVGARFATRPDAVAREIVGIDEDVVALFSSRTKGIRQAHGALYEAARERLGRDLNEVEQYRLKQMVTLSTRKGKEATAGMTHAEMLDQWQARLVDDCAHGLGHLAAEMLIEAEVARHSPAVAEEFSVSALLEEAVAACSMERSTWKRGDLLHQIHLRLPSLGTMAPEDVPSLMNRLADQALSSGMAVEIVGADDTMPEELSAGTLGRLPSARTYAAVDTLHAERVLREAAVQRGGPRLAQQAVAAFLDEAAPSISAEQRAVVEGVAASDAFLAVLSAPAGTGKSYAVARLSEAWEALSEGGRVTGLAKSEKASRVLRESGVSTTANIDAWAAAQRRLAEGRAREGDEQYRLTDRSLIVVDEVSMVGTKDLLTVRRLADAAGARVLLAGDARQLPSVDAGGVFGLIDGRAEVYSLSEVRRFTEAWEAKASLRLRDGDVAVLEEYDRRGRLVEHDVEADAVDAAALGAFADRVSGRSSIVVAGTNTQAAAVAARVREHLVSAGLVSEGGVHLPLDGGTAGVGDEVMLRKIDRSLGVANGDRITVTEVLDDGGLRGVDEHGVLVDLPAEYVAEHVQSGYASTVHCAQGGTWDRARFVTDGGADLTTLYPAMTRGRESNIVHVALGKQGETAPGLDADVERPSAVEVLRGAVERDLTESDAATVVLEREQAEQASMSTVLGQIETRTELAARARMDRHLDALVVDGVLSVEDRARLGADQASRHLSKLLQSVEHGGEDPEEVLRSAITAKTLDGAQSIGKVLSSRIQERHQYGGAPEERGMAPSGLSEVVTEHLNGLHDTASARARLLGEQAAEAPERWLVNALGEVPTEASALAHWTSRAGAVLAYREATGWTDEERALGSAPGVTNPERRAAWWSAWEALGRPAEEREVATLSDGALRVRAAAWKREQEWAPHHADAALREASLTAQQARAEAEAAAALAQGVLDAQEAARLRLEAEEKATLAEEAELVAQVAAESAAARDAWWDNTAVTREKAAAAEREMAARGVVVEQEDLTTGQDWLAEQREAERAEDEHRDITESDLADREEDVQVPDDLEILPEAHVEQDVEEAGAEKSIPAQPDHLALTAAAVAAAAAQERLAEREAAQAAYDADQYDAHAAPDADSQYEQDPYGDEAMAY